MLTDEIINGGVETENMSIELSGLNEVYKNLADEIGLENTLVIFRMYHGTQVSFPGRLFTGEFIRMSILKEYNGRNVRQLALKYNYSERSIWRMLKNAKNTEKGEK